VENHFLASFSNMEEIKMTRMKNKLAAFAVAILLGPTVAAAQTVTLRIADSFPSGHIFHKVLTHPFMDEVEKVSKGTIKFQFFPGQQLGKAKDMLRLTQTDVVDIGTVMPDYVSEKMPLSAAFELPGIFADYCQGVRAFWAATHGNGFLAKNEFGPNKIVPVITFMLPKYQMIIASRNQFGSLKDFTGLKVRSSGGLMDFVLRDLDMVPVHMTPPQVYEGLSRGTIDAAMLPYNSAKSYGLMPLLKSGTIGMSFGTVVATYSVGINKWNQLPPKVRTTLMDVGHQVSMAACTKFLSAEGKAIEEAKAKGIKLIKFSPADTKTIDAAFEKAAREWVASLNRRGKPGTAALATAKQEIAASK
jgi:TRAP-type C4-dicarboxylate transport system substrate-binding protein